MKLPRYSNSIGLYIHVPFCRTKCIYCSFYSEVNFDLHDRYVSSLIKEIELYSKRFRNRTFSTIYIGGGTPSLLNSRQIGRIFEVLRQNFQFEDQVEIAIEANPESVTPEIVKGWKDLGINRVSLGVQSAHDDELKFLGRIHDVAMAEQAIRIIENGGISNFNIDLIFGIPGQTVEKFKESIEWAVSHGAKHISTYSLTVEKGTILHKLLENGKVKLPGEEEFREMYRIREEVLSRYGFKRYEISNFALPGFESRHNRIYWFHGEYLGLGPSAASFVYSPQIVRWQNDANLIEYIDSLSQGNFPPLGEDFVNRSSLLLERIFLYIRTSKGISRELADFVFSKDRSIKRFFECDDTDCRLNFEGMMVADTLSLEIYQILEPHQDLIEL